MPASPCHGPARIAGQSSQTSTPSWSTASLLPTCGAAWHPYDIHDMEELARTALDRLDQESALYGSDTSDSADGSHASDDSDGSDGSGSSDGSDGSDGSDSSDGLDDEAELQELTTRFELNAHRLRKRPDKFLERAQDAAKEAEALLGPLHGTTHRLGLIELGEMALVKYSNYGFMWSKAAPPFCFARLAASKSPCGRHATCKRRASEWGQKSGRLRFASHSLAKPAQQ